MKKLTRFDPPLPRLWRGKEKEHCFGGSSEVVTPDPIPNSVVKHFSPDDI